MVADVPIDEVDWPSIIHRAIWREPPFTYDEKNIVVEKGFRDALILEAVCAYCDQDPDKYFAFICEDRVLREAAEVRIGHLDYSAIYESIGEFAAFIRLTQENLKEEFVRSIRDRARAKFFTRKDQTCLLMRENLISRINKEFRRAMRPGDSSEAIENIFEEPEWEPTEGGVFRLGSTQFVRLRDPRDFHWITELHYVRPYRPKGGEDDLFSLLTGDRLLMLRIGVHWHAEVRSNGAFYGTAVDELELLERQFHTSTEKRREEYGLSSSA